MGIAVQLKRVLLSAAFTAMLAACGGGGGGGEDLTVNDSTPPPAPSEVPNEVARVVVTADGGNEIVIPSNVPGVGGTKILIPAGAALGETINVQVGYDDAAPGTFTQAATSEEAAPVSKTLVVKVAEGGPTNFNQPVTITMPYDATAAGGLPPAILYWDPEEGAYSPVSILSWDEAAGTVTFRTSHFSSFVAVVLKKVKGGNLGVDTGFRLGVDSILHQNFGSYQFGGHGAAFASIASYYYGRKTAGTKPLYDFAQEGVPEQPSDDETTRSAIAVTYSLLMSKWNAVAQTAFNTSPQATGLLMIQAMKATGKPVHLIMRGDTPQDGAHTVVVYGYDATTEEFQIYDSNFPKNVVTLPWNAKDGFGAYSRAAAYSPSMFKHLGFASDDTYGAPSQFRRIIRDWQQDKLKDAFATLQVRDQTGALQQLTSDASVIVRIPYADNQAITGRFNRPQGSVNPVFLHVFHEGVQKTTAGIPIAADGSFTLQFPTKLEQRTEVMLLVSESARDRSAGFSGFGKFLVQPEGKNFFVNFGFETGDTSGWTGATSLLPQGGGGAFTPTKLTKMDIGFDEIATDIPTVVFGQHSIRVNDRDPNYHTTFVAQTATVPLTGNPQLNFKWAAVLEDPQHGPNDQPFVEVTVRNLTKNIDLYNRRFFTNDPGFTGWKSYQNGSWKAIDWQTVVLSGLSQYAGDQIELKIVGADCGQGGHGGYVYLDGEE